MEQNTQIMGMLELIPFPGFCVRDQKIIIANPPALQYSVTVGSDINALLLTGREEYADFQSGCLYLTLRLGDRALGFSVTKVADYHVFLLEQEETQPELQALALAARELRDPLTSIISAADQLFPAGAADDDARDAISRINRGLYQLHRLINNMSHAQPYANGSRTRQETIEIGSFLAELFSRTVELAAHKGIHLHFQNLPAPIYTLADPEMLERAVLNIISNAMKHTDTGGRIAASLSRRGRMLYLQIQDTGCGIPEDIRRSIYSRYLRAPSILDDGGIGLGMVLIRSTAAQHGGTVLIDQPEGAGTRVTMTLAIRQNTDGVLRSALLKPDYAGERDHSLLELSDCLPAAVYDPSKIN